MQSYNGHNIERLVKQWEEDLFNVYDEDVWVECIKASRSPFLRSTFKEIRHLMFRTKLIPVDPLCVLSVNTVVRWNLTA